MVTVPEALPVRRLAGLDHRISVGGKTNRRRCPMMRRYQSTAPPEKRTATADNGQCTADNGESNDVTPPEKPEATEKGPARRGRSVGVPDLSGPGPAGIRTRRAQGPSEGYGARRKRAYCRSVSARACASRRGPKWPPGHGGVRGASSWRNPILGLACGVVVGGTFADRYGRPDFPSSDWRISTARRAAVVRLSTPSLW